MIREPQLFTSPHPLCALPVCQVVIGIGHIDESLDHVGTLDETEEHLKSHTHTFTKTLHAGKIYNKVYHFTKFTASYFGQTWYVQAFPVLSGTLAGLPWPRPLALRVREAGPGKDVMVGQIQISRVHCKLAD